MKQICILIPFLILSVVARAGGQLSFESPLLEYNASFEEEASEGVFQFTNSGDAPITITNMKSSCGCTVPSLEKKTYAPGESGEIRALFTFGQRTGRQSKQITVSTDSPDNPQYTLQFVTHIPAWGKVDPKIVRWRIGEEAVSREITVNIDHPESIQLDNPTIDSDVFTIERVSSEEGSATFSVTPLSTEKRATAPIKLNLSVKDGTSSATKQLIVYGLIR